MSHEHPKEKIVDAVQGSTRREVLIIDDEPEILMILSEYLQEENTLAISTAEGGFAGLALLEKRKFDLVIVDLLMPDLDGLALIQKAHAGNLQKNTKYIVTTGGSLDTFAAEDQADLKKIVSGVLIKPFGMEKLLDMMKRAA